MTSRETAPAGVPRSRPSPGRSANSDDSRRAAPGPFAAPRRRQWSAGSTIAWRTRRRWRGREEATSQCEGLSRRSWTSRFRREYGAPRPRATGTASLAACVVGDRAHQAADVVLGRPIAEHADAERVRATQPRRGDEVPATRVHSLEDAGVEIIERRRIVDAGGAGTKAADPELRRREQLETRIAAHELLGEQREVHPAIDGCRDRPGTVVADGEPDLQRARVACEL